MTFMNEIITYIRKSLESMYPPEEIHSLTQWILEKTCNLPRHQQIVHKDKQLSYTEKQTIQMIVQRLQNSEPIQYVFGETVFYGIQLIVSPSVLIPRPETEELVHCILQEHKEPNLRILDVGTGSGCIAVTLAEKLNQANVYALDISEEALTVAKQNALRNETAVQFIQADIFSSDMATFFPFPTFDLIVSNPPYVTMREKAALKPNVLDFEPHQALFVPDDNPIRFYCRIAEFGRDILTTNGFLYFEINPLFGEKICRMLRQKGYRNIELTRDLSGKERFIKAKL